MTRQKDRVPVGQRRTQRDVPRGASIHLSRLDSAEGVYVASERLDRHR